MAKPLYDIAYLEKLQILLSGLKDRSIELLKPCTGEFIADIGCGIGVDAIKIASKGAKVYGIDHNPEMINGALKNERVGLDVEFICGSADEIDLPDNSIDKIRFDRVFQHLEDYDKVLKEAYRLLKPGGYLQIIDPDHFSITFFLENIGLERKLLDNISYKRMPNSYKTRQLPNFLKNNKFKLDLTEVHQYLINDYSLATSIIRFERVIGEELEQGNISGDELSHWNELKQLTKENFNFSINMMLFAATKI